MKKQLAVLAIKLAKSIMKVVSQQIVSYISSEEFQALVKGMIRSMVNQIVRIVQNEKKSEAKKV